MAARSEPRPEDENARLCFARRYADRMEALLREAKLNQGAKIGIKELVEKTDNPSARPTDLRPSSALTVQAFISLVGPLMGARLA